MTDREQRLTPPTGTVWPPAPLHAAIPLPLFVSAENIEATQTGGCLVVLNKFIRRSMLSSMSAGICAVATPFIALCVPPVYRFIQLHINLHNFPHLFLAVIGLAYMLLLFEVVIIWSIFYFRLSLGLVLLNKATGTVRANGKLRPISAIQAIQVKHVSKRPFAPRFLLQLIWKEDDAMPQTPHGEKVLRKMKAKTILGEFRQEANAEKVAEAVAEFAGVSV